ncbi:PREDICTED: uncharacterized protein LOC105362426 [Ceratosolen solmsi marchali]|uniref:Uncharacterized protein LOC105362426 n=1 Tax=Ceratosolen solmsi marchali TaxID=326594 RepID=A0AAJ6YHI2_9HYME|nr:PREDICTED: uncharacterized protein LOC105362426 [Ceratosolen solmsi marchali]
MKKYRVEAFIIPSQTKLSIESNQIDDVKLANKLKDQSFSSVEEMQIQNDIKELNESLDESASLCNKLENDEQYSSEFSEIFFETNEHIYDEIILPENKETINVKSEVNTEYTKAFLRIEEPIYDEPFVGALYDIKSKENNNIYDVPQTRWALGTSKYRRFGIVAPKLPKRSSSLKSITEDIEGFDTLQEMCGGRGYKNARIPNGQQPEDISEEIFKENWMQRLDALRKLETLLKDKEIALQSRERLLFKKEKELKILERLVKDKMKQAELYAKRYKKSLSSESIINNERNVECRSSNGSKGLSKIEVSTNLPNFPLRVNSKAMQINKDEQILKNLPNSRNSLTSDRLCNRIGSVRKPKHRQKIKYDDFDSTLSADNGDASFIITSKIFDPEIFKKPMAFTRSASERRPRIDQQATASRLGSLTDKDKHTDGFIDVMDEKTFKKISENILASQDQEAIFLNYGLIDKKSLINKKNVNKGNSLDQKRDTYLNLECTNKSNMTKTAPTERPISWSEDTDDWLKKKRQAYNLATKNVMVQNMAEKENFNTYPKMKKSVKNTVKKENSRKKFSLFR